MNPMIEIVLKLQEFATKMVQTCVSLLKVLVMFQRPSALPSKKTKYCSVLGNGPSLKVTLEEDLEFLKTTELFCVNNFASSDYYPILKPQNYVLIDPAFFIYDGVTFDREDIRKTFKAITELTAWEINLYVPQKAKKSTFFREISKKNPNIKIVYFNYIIFKGFQTLSHWFYKTGIASIQSQTVLIAAIFLAINRKFEEIFLFGADTSWHEQFKVNNDNILTFRDVHFYNTDASKEKDIPIYDVIKKQNMTMSVEFTYLARTFRGYELLGDYAKYQKVKIYNASAKSYIDAFERIKV